MTIKSPLAESKDLSLIRNISADQIILGWHKTFQIDISTELSGVDEIHLYRCNKTGLKFFYPYNISGSGDLYRKLSVFDWYYMERKWEHDVAINDLGDCHTVLEVGCGKGDFVKRLCEEENKKAEGIEMSSTAADVAFNRGIQVSNMDIDDLSRYKQEHFDAVCSFQVLEHVPDPLAFIKSMLNVLKPGGKLIISVPNNDSFVGEAKDNLLDQPPHHMTQWNVDVFKSLTEIVPLTFDRVRFEPLAFYHIGWFIATRKATHSKKTSFRYIGKALGLYGLFLKCIPYFRHFIKGHTLYVLLTKV